MMPSYVSPALSSSVATSSRKASESGSNAFGGSSSVPISINRSCLSIGEFLQTFFTQCFRRKRESQSGTRIVIGLGNGARQCAHAQDVALAFRYGNRRTRVEQVEGMRCLHHLFVGRQHQLFVEQVLALRFVFIEITKQVF